MNESRASRYHRARRRAALLWIIGTAGFFSVAILSGAAIRLREAVASPWALASLLAAAQAILVLPITFYRSYWLERHYELSLASLPAWLQDFVKTTVLGVAMSALAAQAAYMAMWTWPEWWWAAAAAATTAMLALLTALGPVVLLPLFHDYRPLERDELRRRLIGLSERAGVSAVDVFEWQLGTRNRGARAALLGAGTTRRIVLSDGLLADYTDDEIEVILAHELGHHAHRDVVGTLAAELAVLAGCFYLADVLLRSTWGSIGLESPSDPAGLPIVALAAMTVWVGATPLLNALSRLHERRADRFALEASRQPDAFVAALRRMAAQNLAEEHPSRAAVWMFHTHPPVESRIAAARARARAHAPAAGGTGREDVRGPGSRGPTQGGV